VRKNPHGAFLLVILPSYQQHALAKNKPIISWEFARMLTTPFHKVVHLDDDHQFLVSRTHRSTSKKISRAAPRRALVKEKEEKG
jgi:hypothetical protein